MKTLLILSLSIVGSWCWSPAVSAQDEANAIANVQKLQELADNLTKVKQQHDALKLQLAQMETRFGPSHPQVLSVKQQLNLWSQYIRQNQAQEDNAAPKRTYKKVRGLTEQLMKAVDQIRPLTEPEQELEKAIKDLRTALAQLEAKETIRLQLERDRASSYQKALQAQLTQRNAALAQMQKNNENKYLQSLILQKEKQYQDMAAKLKDAEARADQESLARIASIKNLQQTVRLQNQQSEAAVNTNQKLNQRIENLESELAEIKTLLKEITRKITSDK